MIPAKPAWSVFRFAYKAIKKLRMAGSFFHRSVIDAKGIDRGVMLHFARVDESVAEIRNIRRIWIALAFEAKSSIAQVAAS